MLTLEELAEKYDRHLKHCIEFDVQPGWLQLANRLLAALVAADPEIQIYQVKAKQGLTCYTDSSVELKPHRLTSNAFRESQHICQWCGEPGELIGWNVWCPTHAVPANRGVP